MGSLAAELWFSNRAIRDGRAGEAEEVLERWNVTG